MGLGLVAFAVDVGALRATWASRDDEALGRTLTALAGEIEDNAGSFEEEIAAGAPTLARAIAELFAGACAAGDHAFQYVYAVEALCAHAGRPLDRRDVEKISARGARLIDAALARLGLDDVLRVRDWTDRFRPPLPIPAPVGGLPNVSTYEADEVVTIASRIAARPSIAVEEAAAGALEDIFSWFDDAARMGVGIVVFYE